ncbi:Nn.00g080310.m01.CDS01 [Neocucurbitaria sp. VM-36]
MNALRMLAGFVGVSHAIPFLDYLSANTLHASTLDIHSRADADPSDLSYVKNWAALGDSYAAGIGAGNPLGNLLHHEDWSCSRWDQAYPSLMHRSDGFSNKSFKFLACSGWTSIQIKDQQATRLDDNSQQVITLSAGGNDVYLSELLNACVYQITPGAAIMDNCKSVMDKAEDAIENKLFGWLDDLYTALTPKLTDDGKIYVTGYAQFWNSNTNQCDGISWKMWDFPGAHAVHLTRENRKRMNDLAKRVNDKIREVIKKKHAHKIVFIDYDPYVVLLQGRFCEPAILEPEPSRPGLLFYNRGTIDEEDNEQDQWGHTELKRAPEDVPKQSFEGSIAVKFEETMREHPDWKMTGDFSEISMLDAHNNTVDGVKTTDVADIVSSLLPDTFKRIFHPRAFLHNLIAQLVLWNIRNERAKILGIGSLPQRSGAVKPENLTCKPRPKDRPRDLVCKETDWRAPKERTDDGSTSVASAIKDFCKKRNGQTAEKGKTEHIYDRWDISGWGVTKRQSLWLRASTGPFSQCSKGTIEEKDCVSVLTDSMNSCDSKSDFTYGFRAQGGNCMEYAVETSASVHEGDPPWAEHVKKYPPPETLMADMYIASGVHQVDCFVNRGGEKWSWDDANAAINQYCNNNLKNGGHSKAFKVKRGGLQISASVPDLEHFPGTPFRDTAWCQGFDWEHKNSDDCKYAFRKILATRMEDHLSCFTHYRCVQYVVEAFDDPHTRLGDVEDRPGHILGAYDVRVSGWNSTGGWNATMNSTGQAWDLNSYNLPSTRSGNGSVFMNSL